MMRKSRTYACCLLIVLLILSAVVFLPEDASAQGSRNLKYRLDLPKEIKKPDLPVSDKAFFGEIPCESVLLELILNNDGSVVGFEKRTLAFMGTKVHATTYKGEGYIRSLLKYAADMKREKKKEEGTAEGDENRNEEEADSGLADVDLVIYASPDVPVYHFQKLIMIACEYGIQIYRIHIRVKDKETGKDGVLSFYVPCVYVSRDDARQKEFLANTYEVTFENGPRGAGYCLEFPSGKGDDKMFYSLEKLEKDLDVLKKLNPKARFLFGIGGFPMDLDKKPFTAKVEELVGILTLLASKDADLKCTKRPMPELIPLPK